MITYRKAKILYSILFKKLTITPINLMLRSISAIDLVGNEQ